MYRMISSKRYLWISLFFLFLFIPAILLAQVPKEAEVHNNLGNEYCDRGEFEKGVKEYEEAIKIYPNYVDAYYNLGVTYYHDLQDYEKAANNFRRFLELEANTPDAQQVQNWLTEIEKQPGVVHPEHPEKVEVAKTETIKEAKPEEIQQPAPSSPAVPPSTTAPPIQIIQAPPPAPAVKVSEQETKEDKLAQANAYKERGNLYSKEGKYQMAVREYLRAIELRPDYTDALYNLAKTYDFDLNDNEKAIKFYEEFLRYEAPNSNDAREVKTWLLKAKMDLAKAKEEKTSERLAQAVQPPQIVPPVAPPTPPPPKPSVEKPSISASCGKYDDLPFRKDLIEEPVQVASLPSKQTQPIAEKNAQLPSPIAVPAQAPSTLPALATAVNSIVLSSYLPNEVKSVQTSIILRSEIRNELMDIFKSANSQDADKLAQLFITKLTQDTLPSGDELGTVEIPGDMLANIQNVYVLSHKDRIELNNEKGNLYRSPQTPNTRKRLEEINKILDDGYEIRAH